MSQLNEKKKEVAPDRIYYDVVTSNFQSTTTAPPVFAFNDGRANPFIQCPEDYYLSILRFTMDSSTLPVFIPSIKPNSADLNDTIYSITLSYGGVDIQRYIQWNAQDDSAQIPAAPVNVFNGLQNNTTGYYNCYNYQYFCGLIYQAFQSALLALGNAVNDVAISITTGNLQPPILNWDSTSQQGVLYAQNGYYDFVNPQMPLGPIEIYMNAPLFALFSTFPSVLKGYAGVLYGKNYLFRPTNIGNINYQPIVPANGDEEWDAIVVFQEGSTTASWSPIVSVVFTSNTLPVNATQVSTPIVYNDGQLQYMGTNAATQNIITDLVSDNGIYRPNLVYTPTAEFRRLTLFGNQPLYNLDLNIFYKLKTGELVPFTLASGGAVTIKIMFEKK